MEGNVAKKEKNKLGGKLCSGQLLTCLIFCFHQGIFFRDFSFSFLWKYTALKSEFTCSTLAQFFFSIDLCQLLQQNSFTFIFSGLICFVCGTAIHCFFFFICCYNIRIALGIGCWLCFCFVYYWFWNLFSFGLLIFVTISHRHTLFSHTFCLLVFGVAGDVLIYLFFFYLWLIKH